MKVAVIGSRTFTNYTFMERVLNALNELSKITQVISGGAGGADSLSEVWADLNDVEKMIFIAEWDKLDQPDANIKVNKFGHKYDAMAGFRRNKNIVNNSDVVIAFWDGLSKGTLDSIQYAKEINKPCKVYIFDKNTQEIINEY